MSLFVFGLGYTAGHAVRRHLAEFAPVAGTVRTPERCEELAQARIDAFVFDGDVIDARLLPVLAEAEAVLVSVQPQAGRDPVLERFAERIAASRARRIVYLSTIGVYGDHGGAWIDESTPVRPESERGRERLGVEDAWRDFGARHGKAVAVLRLAGIYGPGRNVLDDLVAGAARRIDKPGQVFNRIHVEDIGQAIAAALGRDASGTWNITDDEPAAASEVVVFAAEILGIAPPPVVAFGDAEMSPMARSFYRANRRVANVAMKRDLGVTLRYPTYRQGIAALAREMRATSP